MALSSIKDQPPPQPNNQPAVWDLVKKDIEERDRVGVERYGTRLQPFNGRNALIDAYQEALDLVVYLRQAIEEQHRADEILAVIEAYDMVVGKWYKSAEYPGKTVMCLRHGQVTAKMSDGSSWAHSNKVVEVNAPTAVSK